MFKHLTWKFSVLVRIREKASEKKDQRKAVIIFECAYYRRLNDTSFQAGDPGTLVGSCILLVFLWL